MRIISGQHKGRRLIAPKSLPARPTKDLAKEALFNILHHQYRIVDTVVIDLFSGTGNIAYECCSRGAKEVIAVDQHRACISYIQKTSCELDFNIRVVQSDCIQFLKNKIPKADIIFADPPYDISTELLSEIVFLIFSSCHLTTRGLLIIEHTKNKDLSKIAHYSYHKRYGGSVFSFFEK